MLRLQLPEAGRYAKVIVGWNSRTQSFLLECYRTPNAAAEAALAIQLGLLPHLNDLDRALLDFGLAMPSEVRSYLAAARTTDTAELSRLEPLVAFLKLPDGVPPCR